MIRRIVVSLALALVVVTQARAEYFEIRDFHAAITVTADATLEITETIDVYFNTSRHGIYREIPYKYRDDLGERIVTPLTVVSVTDDNGRARPYLTSREGSIVNIRIGDPDRYVKGREVYVITYRVENAMLFLEEHDELYWNVTGNYWETSIERASVTVTVAGAQDLPRDWHVSCYSGEYGQAGDRCESFLRTNSVAIETLGPLSARQGLTISVQWNKGIVTPPSPWRRFLWRINLAENWVFGIPLAALIFMFQLWRRRGRDPRVREAVTVMYEPPANDGSTLTPAETGVLIDERFDRRDLTAGIIGLAQKGYLKIEERTEEGLIFDDTVHTLIREKEADGALTAFESKLMAALFLSGEAVELGKLKNKFYRNLPGLRKALFGQLMGRKFFTRDPSAVRRVYATIAMVGGIAGTAILLSQNPAVPLKSVITIWLSMAVVFLFGMIMPAKTHAGALAKVQTLGFQEFMNRADRDRIQRMGPEVYYRYLPYAIALNVSDHWTEAFEGLLTEPPSWYVAPHGFRVFSPSVFNRSLNATTAALAAATFSAPRGSGSSGGGGGGGGGFSGGGFGGGGGGSW
ncbi:MAG TPA: DUF2207 domain-containing protein [candidate division Zixibacteria bacterium]|nr:DUF2207 domain-containing protein [candidate division Zixibacteria bacterium]